MGVCAMKKVMTVLLALAACAALILTRHTEPKYRVEAVTVRDLTEKIEAVGTVSYAQLYALTPNLAGVVERVFVQEGDAVRKGQAVAQLCLPTQGAQAYWASAQGMELDGVEAQEELVELCTVRAPADGQVVTLTAYEGMQTAPSVALGSLGSEQLCVTALVPESVKEELFEGQKATVRRGGHSYDAKIVRIRPSTEAAAQYVLTLEAPAAQRALCAGMRVDVTVVVQACSGPSVSLQAISKEGTVLCRTETGVAEAPVEVGLCTESYAQLLSGPPVGTMVVTGEE